MYLFPLGYDVRHTSPVFSGKHTCRCSNAKCHQCSFHPSSAASSDLLLAIWQTTRLQLDIYIYGELKPAAFHFGNPARKVTVVMATDTSLRMQTSLHLNRGGEKKSEVNFALKNRSTFKSVFKPFSRVRMYVFSTRT